MEDKCRCAVDHDALDKPVDASVLRPALLVAPMHSGRLRLKRLAITAVRRRRLSTCAVQASSMWGSSPSSTLLNSRSSSLKG